MLFLTCCHSFFSCLLSCSQCSHLKLETVKLFSKISTFSSMTSNFFLWVSSYHIFFWLQFFQTFKLFLKICLMSVILDIWTVLVVTGSKYAPTKISEPKTFFRMMVFTQNQFTICWFTGLLLCLYLQVPAHLQCPFLFLMQRRFETIFLK